MKCDYQAIRRDNERRYGTDIGRFGPMLLADRYDDRTHFIYELLQNAEDALAKRGSWNGKRAIRFQLGQRDLRVSHFGKPFDEADVRGVCGIAESTKDLTAIGRFGIGFKSVYAFTDRPEIYSGEEGFAVENFVWPVGTEGIPRETDETVVILPMREPNDRGEIEAGLKRLGPSSLLFLRAIEEIEWSVEGASSGLYLRSQPEWLGDSVRRGIVLGQTAGSADIEESWLIFSRPVCTPEGAVVGHVEVAFILGHDAESGREAVRRVARSPLVVFFPTAVETHLGFLVQGPYRTTPSRDNVPRTDQWNLHCVRETATLLVEALRWMRDYGLLNAAALCCLPLDPGKFGEGTLFAPLFATVKNALSSAPLLPRFDAGHTSAATARLSRTQELRVLFSSSQLAALFGHQGELFWLSSDITLDRTPDLRQYLIRELGIAEVTPETIISRLDKRFLEAQSDPWITRLYEFLNGQPGLRHRLTGLPLIRCEDGTHVTTHADGRPRVFLPSKVKTEFPTVHPAVCATDAAQEFLRSLGLTEPDPVDDVIWNVLPKYNTGWIGFNDADDEGYFRRILGASATDSKGQRERLLVALRETAFVMAVDAGDGTKRRSKPGELYIATERLKDLFAAVPGVYFVDDSYTFLRGDAVRELLEACGATRYLQPAPCEKPFTEEQRRAMRVDAGCEDCTWEEPIQDHTLRGLDLLLEVMPTLDVLARKKRAALLWEALDDVEARRGSGTFSGTYGWRYYHRRIAEFDAAFVRKLNATAWVPDANGDLQLPERIVFDTLRWKANAFLLSKLRFKPPIIDQLAKEVGIEPGVLYLLKTLGVTSVAELRERLGLEDKPTAAGIGSQDSVEDALKKLLGDTFSPTPAVLDREGAESSGSGGHGGGRGTGARAEAGLSTCHDSDASAGGQSGRRATSCGPSLGKQVLRGARGRPFISYVAAHPDEEELDPDGLDPSARLALETKAIEIILSREPQWHRTSTHNPGYDLFEAGEGGEATCWCEVKAMTGALLDRPIGLSRTQFGYAQEHGEAYWLYVVEHAGTDSARIVRIQNPAGKARTFSFDHGWLAIADMDAEKKTEGD